MLPATPDTKAAMRSLIPMLASASLTFGISSWCTSRIPRLSISGSSVSLMRSISSCMLTLTLRSTLFTEVHRRGPQS